MTKALVFASMLLTALYSCNSGPDYTQLYRMEKQFWDAGDYENAIYKISSTAAGDKKPCYGVPETAPVFAKLVNKQNVAVIVEDEALGVQHRYEFAESMFGHSRDMYEAYSTLNREDKYEYPQELVDVLSFNLYVQNAYFELGNQNILKNADDPNETRVKNIITSNQQILVDNYTLYLDLVNDEAAFTTDALQGYINILNEYFPPLIDKYPNANFMGMKEKCNKMLNKAKSESLKSALTAVITKIDANSGRIEQEKKAAADSSSVRP
jgi:hypothetical protein